ncbi:MAG: RagB/SusD family nutrient uptake outer membrane protein [Paludibacter sp.]
MKKVCKIMMFVIIASASLVSCQDVLNVDTDRITWEKDYQMHSLNDTIYTMVGIYSQLQKLADNYVLLGELRGDLLDVTENSNQNLRDINNFEISKTNPYANIKDYYAVINNCNYLIQYIDTARILKGEKVMYRYYAAAKGIRAWTYMQIVLNFGTAKYYEKPLLTLADAQIDYPEYNMEQLAAVLIPDLEPWKGIKAPNFVGSQLTFPIHFLLGDLYLWTNRYKEAATEYHTMMFKEYNNSYADMLINKSNTTSWVLNNNIISSTVDKENWRYTYMLGGGEAITTILAPTTYGQKFDLDSLNMRYELTPSAISLNNWDTQKYFNTITNSSVGDMRKLFSVINKNTIVSSKPNNLLVTTNPVNTAVQNIVYKYLWNSTAENVQSVMIYRASLLYLRYAEAVNRMGKPNLAFAVLKNGLRSTTMANPKIIPENEKSAEEYMNFNSFKFDNNVGIRSRGLGPNTEKDTTYVLPLKPLLIDSVEYVEDLIQQELALETAYEGNRFHDLIRLAIRRGDNSYLAKKIAAKHVGDEARIEGILSKPINWYIKK